MNVLLIDGDLYCTKHNTVFENNIYGKKCGMCYEELEAENERLKQELKSHKETLNNIEEFCNFDAVDGYARLSYENDKLTKKINELQSEVKVLKEQVVSFEKFIKENYYGADSIIQKIKKSRR